jgi:hypothetical protein
MGRRAGCVVAERNMESGYRKGGDRTVARDNGREEKSVSKNDGSPVQPKLNIACAKLTCQSITQGNRTLSPLSLLEVNEHSAT